MVFRSGKMETTIFKRENIFSGVLDSHSLATEVADYLARRGMPFAQAHEIAGATVRACETRGIGLHELSISDLKEIHPLLDSQLMAHLTAEGAVASRNSLMGTSIASVTGQIAELVSENNNAKRWIHSEKERFSGMMNL